ncbi:MAG: arsenate reductase (glutaredoxin) [Gammaproteobacteria bacterium]|nr:MAG: arsenate reductase (glutaredoxin) [Gammaproteobacteria bacterium]
MSDNVTFYHNPRCSKSRQTLALLEGKGIKPTIVKYLETPPDPATLRNIIDKLGIKARELLRTKEAEYKEAGLDNPDLTDEQIIALMQQYPKLIERPIVVKGNRAVLGRPSENVEQLLK